MKIYVGCSLTYATEEFRNIIESFKNELRKNNEVLDFIGLENGTEEDVYMWDKNCVESCDLFIAECSYPSTGLGYELGLANKIGKPILAFAKKDAKVTRMILGINTPNFTFNRYNENIIDVLPVINEKINYLNK